jgi:hypothetical protein
MIFGDKNIYAIEIYHQPQDNDSFYMCGRMCIYLNNNIFGDLYNEYCFFPNIYMTLVDKIKNIDILEYDFKLENDFEIFNFLDDKLYVGNYENKTCEQIIEDNKPYYRFELFTNMGEMFDRTKSFIYMDKNKKIHILYQNHKYNKTTKEFEDDGIMCCEFDKNIFENITNDFIKWYKEIEKCRKK